MENISTSTPTTTAEADAKATRTLRENNQITLPHVPSESSILTPNTSSANLISQASQNMDTSSITTNLSSDFTTTYDSDSTRLLDGGSTRSRTHQDARTTQASSNLPQSSGAIMVNQDSTEWQSSAQQTEHHFTIGSESSPGSQRNGDSMLYMMESRDDEDDKRSQRGRYSREPYSDHHDLELEEDENDQVYDGSHKQVIVGICAMEKKAESKPMKEILRRLEDYFEYIKTLVFNESVILNKPIEEWPLCDCLISFHSKGFPLSKAIEYARLRKPFLVNDLDIQYDIQDRRKVYKFLEEADIELPRYAVLDRDSANPEERELIESDDHIEVANVVFNKPFVEKPISAEDHNICIYYPAHAGGGSQRLFRKIGCRSSVYSNESHVRKTGSYIYEEFMPTDGTDVKVYTAGPDYAHAEARKSPALDGKVERDSDGKEIRYPVILTNREKLIARKVCLAFKQTVCGFDLLRANGRSYVCDVNGFSFVKSSMKYYEDCSKILGNMMLRALAPQLHIPWSIPFQLDDPPIVPTTFGRMMELRCVIAVIRHGDRTPKQKMKLEVKHHKFFDLYHKYGNTKNGQAKLKKPKQLQEVLDIARYLLGELLDQPLVGEVVEPRVKLKQLKSVLEMYGHFSGINRKVQLKYQPNGRPRRSSSEDDCAREPSLVLILKWGGELTPAGRVQAEDLGRCFRRLYPASGDYSGPQGLGLLRLHSTFRHDLKIYASDEGRVQMTAGAFAKGFLALEGELTPILFQMVKSANTNGLLDNDCESSKCQKLVKERLHEIMQKNMELTSEDIEILNPTRVPSIEEACKFIRNPYEACEKVYKLIKELNALIKSKRQDNGYTQEYHLYHGETWDLLQRRWAKLEKDFKFRRSKKFDISKIPDIYDCIKYDLQHNQHTLQFQFAHELHTYAKALADIVIPQEYGMTSQEKLMIGLGTCSPLLRKIQADLLRNADSSNEDDTESVNRLDPKYSYGVSSPDRHVRTRLYFTSESHIHSLVTALQYGGLLDVKRDEQWKRSMEFLSAISELNYLSQIVIMLYEDPTKEPISDDRFHVEVHFSSGVINRISQQNERVEPEGPGFRPHPHSNSSSNQHRRRLQQQLQLQQQQQQQLSTSQHEHQLPPTYHTIHHCQFSPSTLSSVAQLQSAFISTSPGSQLAADRPSHLSNLHQRYLAHKQQQVGSEKQYFTMSASVPIQCKSGVNPRACSVADVSQYCGGPSSLISTAVISGSSPELVAVCPYSPTIRPLETLHNELSLKQFNEFITRLTRNYRSSLDTQLLRSQQQRQQPEQHQQRQEQPLAGIAQGSSSAGNNNELVADSSQQHSMSVERQQQQQQPQQQTLQQQQHQQQSSSQHRLHSASQLSARDSSNCPPMVLSPGNSLSNSLIWSYSPSSLASPPDGPCSPSQALELWSKLELEEQAMNESNSTGVSSNSASKQNVTPNGAANQASSGQRSANQS